MDPIVGYIATGVVSLSVGLVLQRLIPRSKLVYWLPHNFFFDLKAEKVVLQTNALTVQNTGRRPAEDVQILHKLRPDFFQVSPSLQYFESETPAGEHVITVPHLGPSEYFTIQLLSYKTVPQLLSIRCKDGPAVQIPIMLQRVYPRWFNASAGLLLVLGLGLAAYGIVKAVLLVVHLLGRAT
jgi:hypothetical protein